ncbi:MFS general substrate transporter [Agrocybe pediades]|nr:MFS general substrate transporter [Agrocybe pediades]
MHDDSAIPPRYSNDKEDGAYTVTNTRTPSVASKEKSGMTMEKGNSQPEAPSVNHDMHAVKEMSTLRAIGLVTILTLAMLINIANATAVSIALPTISREFDLQPAQGCLLLVCGRLADVYGRKKIFMIGSLWMTIFTMACGFSNNIMTMDILRGFQGVGGALMIPSALGILAHSFPPSRARSLAFATFAAGAPIGSVFGTAVGGVLTEFTAKTWRTSFWLIAGLAACCFVGGQLLIDRDPPTGEKDRRVDWIGAFLVTAGLVLIVFVLSQGELAPKKWGTNYIIALIVVGVLLIAAFLYWQHYLEKIQDNPNAPYSVWTPPPLMRLTIWTRANGRFAATLGIAFTNWSAFLAWSFWVQLYFQDYKGYTPLDSVVKLLPMFVTGLLCNVFVGFMAPYVPIIYLFVIGTGSTTLSCLLFAIINPKITYWGYAFNSIYLSCVGADFVFASGTLFLSKFALPHEQSVAGALFNTMVQLGTAMGVTVSTVVFNNVGKDIPEGGDTIDKYRAAQWAAFAFGVIATALCVISFRGVGVVGERARKPGDAVHQASENEKGTSSASTTVEDIGGANSHLIVPPPSGGLKADIADQSYLTTTTTSATLGTAYASSSANTVAIGQKTVTPSASSDIADLKAKDFESLAESNNGEMKTDVQ